MTRYVKVGERIRERLLVLGYVKPNGDPDVQEFCWRHRFGTTHVYAWIAERMTPFKDLIRLCEALQCSSDWLLAGKEVAHPKALPARGRQPRKLKSLLLVLGAASALWMWPSGGVLAQAGTLQVREIIDEIPLIGSRARRRSLLSLGLAPA